MSEQKLAAVIYAEGQGPRMDEMLIEVVKRLRQDNLRLAGAVLRLHIESTSGWRVWCC